jgi:hypothetical protein
LDRDGEEEDDDEELARVGLLLVTLECVVLVAGVVVVVVVLTWPVDDFNDDVITLMVLEAIVDAMTLAVLTDCVVVACPLFTDDDVLVVVVVVVDDAAILLLVQSAILDKYWIPPHTHKLDLFNFPPV